MFLRWDALEEHIVFGKRLAEIGRTLIVQNVEFGWVPEMKEVKMSSFPSVPNCGCETIWNGKRVNGVGIVMIQEENVVVAPIRRCVEVARLIRIRLEECCFGDEHGADLMRTWFQQGSKVGIVRESCWNGGGLGGA
jgi:hypothetical protein